MELFGFIITIEKAYSTYLTRRSIRKALVRYAKSNALSADYSAKIPLIRKHRLLTTCGLKESKDAIEAMFGCGMENLYK